MYKQRTGIENPSYVSSNDDPVEDGDQNGSCEVQTEAEEPSAPKRDNWGNDIEFLMSCIALSVGLGNVWRFPFIALENGGGAFLIPYLITLFLVGKPIYYLEMILGQFSSRANVKMYNYAPIMRGIAYGQTMAIFFVTTYYSSLMALTLHYFIDSFYPTLPWSYCRKEWGDLCIDSKLDSDESRKRAQQNSTAVKKSSAEFYFINIVLQEKSNIDDGLGVPNWKLVLTLAFAWLVITVVIFKGIKSSGKVAYFLAIFPYVILLVLLIRALTLPGAFDGVLFFLTPQWDKLLDAKVWYAAVTQVFFSLTVCYGVVVMYASFNRFRHNIRRDCNIVTSLDTLTSLLSGIVIFGILGNLAYESNNPNIKSVVKSGPALAFISYPDAIAKFQTMPQIFSAFFFLMLFILGIGSNVGIISTVITVISDQFPNIKRWIVVLASVLICYGLALLYVTPGGQFVLNYIDFYAVTLVVTVLGVFELLSASWIYGVKNICRDIKFMLGVETSVYYRICWAIITPIFMAAVYIYMLVDYKPLTYNDVRYPESLYALGWCITAIGVGQLLIWGSYAIWSGPELSFDERFRGAFKPASDWGPLDPTALKEYQDFVRETTSIKKTGTWSKILDNIFG
ncbi:sodium-dependent nutrient amino acid transporter 1 isoform X1 [Stomoxys calcitrans]|uniref:sodium-dependent nutrient amino acid transporter 1 isoform X1 n=1 Tax=Stomoxys calcitrans TaxID=35570 RepID=UPI0027E30AA3|nr:sodium-dependent nutrient amino acid transporter 1 isoform X1 [Stomoxys calcitrans]